MSEYSDEMDKIVSIGKASVAIMERFSNDPLTDPPIGTESGPLPNLRQVIQKIEQDAAVDLAARVERYLAPSASDPSTRDDGSPLQMGDKYFNTVEDAEYLFTATGWRLNAAPTADSQISVAPAFATMITRNQQEVNRDTLEAAFFGVKAGTADMTSQITLARDYFRDIGGGRINLPWGEIYHSTIDIPRGVEVHGKSIIGTRIRPVADGIGALLNITGGLAGVRFLAMQNNNGYQVDGIVCNKGAAEANLKVEVSDVFASGFRSFFKSTDGDCINLSNLNLVSNQDSIIFMNDGRNGSISKSYILGGNGPDFRHAGQGVEGFVMDIVQVLPGPAGSWGLRLSAGLDFKIIGCVFDQIVSGQAVILDGTNHSINGVKSLGNWFGRQVGAAGADFGLYITGDVEDVSSTDDTYTGWQQSAIKCAGTQAQPIADLRINNPSFYDGDRNLRDISMDYCQRAVITGAKHSGVASIVEGVSCDGTVTNGSYSKSSKPSSITKGLKYMYQSDGMKLRSSGSAVIPSPARTVTIPHGLSYAPSTRQVSAKPNAFSNNRPGEIICTATTASSITLVCANDPGASNLGVDWYVDLTLDA